MVFKSRLPSGARNLQLATKTFHYGNNNVNLQHTSGEFIIPYLMSDSTTYEYKIEFETNINDENFSTYNSYVSI